MEFRITFPLRPGCFDIWAPHRLRLVLDELPKVCIEKSLIHEYLIFANPHVNLKLAAGGSKYDLKWLAHGENDGASEQWVSCIKGSLDAVGSIEAVEAGLASALEDATITDDQVVGLKECLRLLRSQEYTRVTTTKTNVTAKGKPTVEQIDFVATWADGRTATLRSLSLEDGYQPAVAASVAEAIQECAKPNDVITLGGIPKALMRALA